MATLTTYSKELGAQACPCGYLSDPVHPCTCAPIAIHRYRSRISGPLLDRIDIHIEVPAVKYRELADRSEAESSAAIAARVKRSREIQRERYRGTKIHCNAQMTPRFIKKHCELDAAGNRMLELVTDRLGFSARTYVASSRSPARLPILTAQQTSMSSTLPKRSSTGVWTGRQCDELPEAGYQVWVADSIVTASVARNHSNLAFSRSLTCAGLALPPVAFMTWPTKKPNSLSLPER